MIEFDNASREKAISIINLEISQKPNIDAYLFNLGLLEGRSKLGKQMIIIARYVEPHDRTLGPDEEYPYAGAFVAGSLVALRIVREFVPPEVQERMFHVPIAHDPGKGESLERRHIIADDIIDYGERGMASVPEFDRSVEEWSEKAFPDIRIQPFFRRGFGIVMYMMHEAYREHDISEMTQAYKDGVDWDKGLADLLGPAEE